MASREQMRAGLSRIASTSFCDGIGVVAVVAVARRNVAARTSVAVTASTALSGDDDAADALELHLVHDLDDAPVRDLGIRLDDHHPRRRVFLPRVEDVGQLAGDVDLLAVHDGEPLACERDDEVTLDDL